MNARIIHGLLWREWLLHHVMLAWIFSAWLLGIWIFPIHPLYFLLPFGILSALLVAPSFGGSDAGEGSEEFSFALPPTRSQRYLVRLALGGGILASLLLVGVAAAAFDLPQKVWGLLFESGFTAPFSPTRENFGYVLAVVLPLSVFAECFAAASSSRSPDRLVWTWLRGLILNAGIFVVAVFVEVQVWNGRMNGWVTCPAFALWSLARLVYGYRDYKSKEGVSGLPRVVVRSGSRTLIVVVVVMLALMLLSLVLFAGARRPSYAAPVRSHPAVKED